MVPIYACRLCPQAAQFTIGFNMALELGTLLCRKRNRTRMHWTSTQPPHPTMNLPHDAWLHL